MANVIIGIHGLGNKPPKQILEHWWLHAIREGLKMHGFKTNTPKFELVYWADITHEQPLNIFVKDPESPFYAAERYVKSPKNFHVENHSIRRKVVDFLNEQINKLFLNADFSLNYSFITNSILRNYFNDLNVYYKEECTIDNAFECKIKELIRNRLLTVLEKYKNDNVILVSHSMGSIVAFDVLSFMAENIKVHTFITMGSPLGLPIVINKIALEQKQRIVGKNHMITPNSVSRHWYNFSDISDNVALNYKLADSYNFV